MKKLELQIERLHTQLVTKIKKTKNSKKNIEIYNSERDELGVNRSIS